MKCQYVDSKNSLVCMAGGIPYLLNELEADEFCNSDRHRRCPFFLEMATQVNEGEGLDYLA